MSTVRTRYGFWMNLPDGWMALDPTEAIPVQLARLLDARAADDPNVAAHRQQIERQIRSALAAARDAEVSFGAILAAFTADGLPIAGSLALTRHAIPGDTDPRVLLGRVEGQGGALTTVIDVPFVGPVVRSASRERLSVPAKDLPPGAPDSLEVAIFQYLLPVPGGQEVVVASCATPTEPMFEIFGRLFDAMISTFQFVPETD